MFCTNKATTKCNSLLSFQGLVSTAVVFKWAEVCALTGVKNLILASKNTHNSAPWRRHMKRGVQGPIWRFDSWNETLLFIIIIATIRFHYRQILSLKFYELGKILTSLSVTAPSNVVSCFVICRTGKLLSVKM